MILLIRVPYYFGGPKRDPNLDNYPHLKGYLLDTLKNSPFNAKRVWSDPYPA